MADFWPQTFLSNRGLVNKHFLALFLCIFSAHALATEHVRPATAEERHVLVTAIGNYWPDVIARQLNNLEKNNINFNFNQILKEVLYSLEDRRATKRLYITQIAGMVAGAALFGAGLFYLYRGRTELAEKYNIWAMPCKNLLAGSYACVLGGLLAKGSADTVNRINNNGRSCSNFHGLAAALNQIKNSPACYISDKDFARHLLAQIIPLMPTAEWGALFNLEWSI